LTLATTRVTTMATMMTLTLLTTLLQEGAGDSAEKAGGGGLNFLFPTLLIIGIFYVVLIMPERKKQKQRKSMIDAMKKGDKVMTSSGIYGSVAQIQEEVIVLQVSDGVRMRFNRAAIQTILSDDKSEKAEKPEAASV
jgi:preprotein translocase subunit YajC